MSSLRGRFAPSPTGAMHLGNARTALIAWLMARAGGGRIVMRIEDLDRPRTVAGAEADILDQLAWLGLDWDEGPDRGGPSAPYRQSERTVLYDEAAQRLLAAGRAFPCACSRAQVARAASAPHGEADEGPRYPGTCKALPRHVVERGAAAQGRQPAVRFDGQGAGIEFVDLVAGRVDPLGPEGVDDFVIRRADGSAAYQLAVVVDDAAMKITQVVRGDDLLRSTPRQIALYRALGWPIPVFAHVPLVLSPTGDRLAKRNRPPAVGDLRRAGVAPEVIVGALAASANLCPAGGRVMPRDLVGSFHAAHIGRTPTTIPSPPAAARPRPKPKS